MGDKPAAMVNFYCPRRAFHAGEEAGLRRETDPELDPSGGFLSCCERAGAGLPHGRAGRVTGRSACARSRLAMAGGRTLERFAVIPAARDVVQLRC